MASWQHHISHPSPNPPAVWTVPGLSKQPVITSDTEYELPYVMVDEG